MAIFYIASSQAVPATSATTRPSVLVITTLFLLVSGLTLVPIHELIELLVNRLP